MTALARWRQAKLVEDGLDKKVERRPYLATECDDVKEAEKWRIQIIREISKKVSQIQNAGLGEFKIRDLNDEINKLLREKRHWEARIIELGGKDLRKRSRMLDREGQEVSGSKGYKYFGAARDLPGVRELFDAAPAEQPKKTRAELMKDIDAQYYGYRDDDDGLLVPLEVESEREAIAEVVQKWREEGGLRSEDADEFSEMDEAERMAEAMTAGKEGRYIAHVVVPTQKDIEDALLRRKKQELMQMYALEDVVQDEDEEMASEVEKKEEEKPSKQEVASEGSEN